jgi:hypothetical protein
MQLVAPFVNTPVARHECSNLLTSLLSTLWEVARNMRQVAFLDVWLDLLGDKKYFGFRHSFLI